MHTVISVDTHAHKIDNANAYVLLHCRKLYMLCVCKTVALIIPNHSQRIVTQCTAAVDMLGYRSSNMEFSDMNFAC